MRPFLGGDGLVTFRCFVRVLGPPPGGPPGPGELGLRRTPVRGSGPPAHGAPDPPPADAGGGGLISPIRRPGFRVNMGKWGVGPGSQWVEGSTTDHNPKKLQREDEEHDSRNHGT